MQFLLVLPLLNHFIQLCTLVPFLLIDSYISINYCCYDFWLAMKQLLVGDKTTSHKTLYYSLIHSYLSYRNLVWGNATQSALRQTILLQKQATCLINNAKYNSHTDPLFHSSRILKVTDLVEYQAGLGV